VFHEPRGVSALQPGTSCSCIQHKLLNLHRWFCLTCWACVPRVGWGDLHLHSCFKCCVTCGRYDLSLLLCDTGADLPVPGKV
jgi:hypothetical protein